MPTTEELDIRSKRIVAEVQEKLASPDLTEAEKNAFMVKAQAEVDEIGFAYKNLSFAKNFRVVEDAEPAQQDSPARRVAQKNLASYQEMAKAATAGSRSRGSFNFEFHLKNQGVAGLQGEAASGTTPPSPLAPGAYFLTGPAGPAVEPEFIPGIVQLRFYQNVIASLFPSFPVSSPVVSYLRESSWTNASAPTPEGSTFPTSTNAVLRFTEEVGKITNLIRTTDEQIQDAPYFWSLIQQRLSQGVSRQEEVQLLAGSGMPGVDGILNRTAGFTQSSTPGTAQTNVVIPGAAVPGAGAGPGTVASLTAGRLLTGDTTGLYPTGVEIAEAILGALTDIRVKTFFEPDAIVLNPSDWQVVRLAKSTTGEYLGGSFFGADYGQPKDAPIGGAVETGLALWGKRVVTTPAIPAGFVLVGAFGDGGQVLRRGGLEVQATNTNGVDFEQGQWTVRAEERVGLLVERPEVFELIQLATK